MAINKYGDHGIRWISHGMLRIEISRMKQLFQYPLNKITEVGHNFLFVCILTRYSYTNVILHTYECNLKKKKKKKVFLKKSKLSRGMITVLSCFSMDDNAGYCLLQHYDD